MRLLPAILLLVLPGCCASRSPTLHPEDASEADRIAAGICRAVDPNAYGACEWEIGFAFAGAACVRVTGCDCGADCAAFFPSLADCATTCAAQGRCNPAKLRGPGGGSLTVGDFCDELHACGPYADPTAHDAVVRLMPPADCAPAGPVCGSTDALRCRVDPGAPIDAATYEALCAMSLIESVRDIQCIVWL